MQIPLGAIRLPFTAGLISISPQFSTSASFGAGGDLVARLGGIGVEVSPGGGGEFEMGFRYTETGGTEVVQQMPGWFRTLTPIFEVTDGTQIRWLQTFSDGSRWFQMVVTCDYKWLEMVHEAL